MVTSVGAKRAVGYFRVSTVGQASERHVSLPTQESHFQEYCRRMNVTPVGSFTDTLTGKRDDRQAYRQMVEFVLDGGADVVVVQYLDRFGRNPREILRRYWELEERGVSVIATDEDIKEELQLLIKAYMAGAESRRISERVRSTMSKAIARGIHVGNAPYGLRAVRQIKKDKIAVSWEINDQEASIVRLMYKLAVEDRLGYKGIADRLTDMGYRAREGRPFATFTIHSILNNPAMMGTLVYGRRPKKGNAPVDLTTVDGFFPPILTRDEWQRLQQHLAIRREHPRGKGHVSDYLLSGIARCGQCGGPMRGKTKMDAGRRYMYYVCRRSTQSKALCGSSASHSAPELEKAILEYLARYDDPVLVRGMLKATEQREIEREETELKGIEKRLAELDNALVKDMDRLDRGVLNEAEFTKINTTRRAEVTGLDARRAQLQTRIVTERDKAALAEKLPQAIRGFLEDFRTIDIRQQKAQLQTILKAAYIHSDGRIELEFRQ